MKAASYRDSIQSSPDYVLTDRQPRGLGAAAL